LIAGISLKAFAPSSMFTPVGFIARKRLCWRTFYYISTGIASTKAVT
jgi:hypothetical protein